MAAPANPPDKELEDFRIRFDWPKWHDYLGQKQRNAFQREFTAQDIEDAAEFVWKRAQRHVQHHGSSKEYKDLFEAPSSSQGYIPNDERALKSLWKSYPLMQPLVKSFHKWYGQRHEEIKKIFKTPVERDELSLNNHWRCIIWGFLYDWFHDLYDYRASSDLNVREEKKIQEKAARATAIQEGKYELARKLFQDGWVK
ncbi:MAG: hypothetical protein Q9182_001072 [Xanthomendoza sp. 2 TL-2023]